MTNIIENITVTRDGVEYEFGEDAPDSARDRLSEKGDPTNPTIVRDILDSS